MTPVLVSVSWILHKNSSLLRVSTSLSFVFVLHLLCCILYLYVQHFQFPNLYFVNRQPFRPYFSLLCSALQTSPLYFGANLVIRAQPCEQIIFCYTLCTWVYIVSRFYVVANQVSILHCTPNAPGYQILNNTAEKGCMHFVLLLWTWISIFEEKNTRKRLAAMFYS